MSNKLILKNVNIFDGVNSQLIWNKDILVEDGKIDKVQDPINTYNEAMIVDLTGCFVAPGFIDTHMHMMLNEIPNKEKSLTMISPGGELYPNADSSYAYMSVANCFEMLKAGFTTVMDGGGRNFIECALKEAINKEIIEGPRYLVAGKQITTNRPHFVGLSLEPSGPYGMRKAIRDLVWWGVDFIKLQLSPPIRMLCNYSKATDFTFEEIQAAIDEAHNYGLPVHAHLRSAESIKKFIRAEGDYVVHGTGIDDEGIEMMLKSNKYMLPTLLSPSPTLSKEFTENRSKAVLNQLTETANMHWESVAKAYNAGVKMAFSSDAGTLGIQIGTNALEFLSLQKIGMSPVEALRCATSEAAKVAGLSSEIGFLREGYTADFVVMTENPLEDLSATRRVLMTIHNGKIVFDSGKF